MIIIEVYKKSKVGVIDELIALVADGKIKFVEEGYGVAVTESVKK